MSTKLLSDIFNRARQQKEKVRRACFAEYVITNPHHAQFLTKSFYSCFDFLPAAYFKSAAVLEAFDQHNESVRVPDQFSVRRPLTILHSFSSPEAKGTDVIRATLEALKNDGFPIDFKIVSGLSHIEVVNYRKRFDLVIDQLYSDAPLASAATESLVVGVPVIVAGYEFPDYLLDGRSSLPGFFIKPGQLAWQLKEILLKPILLNEQKRKIKAFNIKLKRGLGEAAAALVSLVEKSDGFSPIDPVKLPFFHGMGVSEVRLRRFLSAYVATFGLSALLTPDKLSFIESVEAFIATSE